MTSVYLYTLASVLLVSAVSLVGVFALSLARETLRKYVFVLVSIAIGALVGGAFLHLIPESFEEIANPTHVSLAIIFGVLLFFVLEKVLHWHTHHALEEKCCHETSHNGLMIVFGDGMHNFLDGIIIAVAYLAGVEIGIATTVAVLMHEIPQEIGDFGVLIHSGYTTERALFLNFLSATTAVLGALITLVLGEMIEGIALWLMPIAAGGFIYIAMSDLVPEIHKMKGWKYALIQVLAISVGILAMLALLFME